jgi:hypothetical protein
MEHEKISCFNRQDLDKNFKMLFFEKILLLKLQIYGYSKACMFLVLKTSVFVYLGKTVSFKTINSKYMSTRILIFSIYIILS